MTYDERQTLVLELLNTLNTLKAQGQIPSADDIATLLNGNGHALVKEWVRKNTTITTKELERAMSRVRIKADLGTVPNDATELVQAVVKRDKMACKYNGMLTHQIIPVIDGLTVGPDDMSIPDVAEFVHFHYPEQIDITEFTRSLRIITERHKLGFSAPAINDAVEEWYAGARKTRRHDLFQTIRGPILTKDKARVDTMWLEIAKRTFVTDDATPAEFVVAVLKKYMHQVKRKLRKLDVYDHLMPVILGPQGVGKSTFVRAMLEPIKELTLNVDFKMIEDDRNIDIWKSYSLFIDEMGYASKANIDTIKNAITAETLTRKPLYTNAKVEIVQNSTFIGCSNKELEQLIKDPTGIRRFVALRFRPDPDWSFNAEIDWLELWRSVEHDGPDGMAAFKQTLADAQESTREMGRVEHWLDEYDQTADTRFGRCIHQGRIPAKALYESFREFEDDSYPGVMKTSLTEWGYEMKRLSTTGQNKRFECLGKVGGAVRYQVI